MGRERETSTSLFFALEDWETRQTPSLQNCKCNSFMFPLHLKYCIRLTIQILLITLSASLHGADLALCNSGFDTKDVWKGFLAHLGHESIRSIRIESITWKKVYNPAVI